MLGPETEKHLTAHFEASFKREVDADEAIWRSLPFFGALLALAVAVLPSVYRAAAGISGLGARVPTYFLLTLSAACFARASVEFWRVIRPRDYQYLPSDVELLDYAETLDGYFSGKGVDDTERDRQVRDRLRRLMLVQTAEVTSHNRGNNGARAKARNQTLLFGTAGLALAFLSEATILTVDVFRPTHGAIKSGDDSGHSAALRPGQG